MASKFTASDAHNQLLQQKLSVLSRKLDEDEDTAKISKRGEEEHPDQRDNISRGECGANNLLSEVDELTKRILEIEGKDEELIKMENYCQGLAKRLETESSKSHSLRVEVDQLNCRIIELEKLEDAFSRSNQECRMLKSSLEKEMSVSKHLTDEVNMLKIRIKELEAVENQMEKTELTLKEDLTKLKALTVMLVNERKAMNEKIAELQRSSGKLQAEQDRATSVSEKLIEDSKNAGLEEKTQNVIRGKEEFRQKLTGEEERSNNHQMKVSNLKKNFQPPELVEREFLKNKSKEEDIKASSNQFHEEDNKVKDLTQEVKRLKRKLKDMRLAEDGLLKTEDEFQVLQKRYINEQQRAKKLMEELEISKKELYKYRLVEKKESNQEDILYKHLKEEEAKSRDLTIEVETLREKINEFMGTEESISRLRKDHSILQRKLSQEEVKNKELAKEMEDLVKNLERYQSISKSLQPGLNTTHFSDLHISSKEVQTSLSSSQPMEYRSLPLLERVVLNGKLYTEDNAEDDSNYHNKVPFTKCSASLINTDALYKTRRQSKESQTLVINSKPLPRQNGNFVQQGDVVLRHCSGQPLHIKVTPDHGQNTATLEITSPGSENAHSYTSTAVIPTSGAPPKQQITIIQSASMTSSKMQRSSSSEGLCTPDRAMSPIAIATFAKPVTPDSSTCPAPERALSPIQMVSVTTGSPDRSQSAEFVDAVGSHAVFRVAQERHNWQPERSTAPAPKVISTDDNKIHIHLGNPYIQAINSTPSPTSPCYVAKQGRRNSGIFPGNSTTKGDSKITSSLTIMPNITSTSKPPHIPVGSQYD